MATRKLKVTYVAYILFLLDSALPEKNLGISKDYLGITQKAMIVEEL